MTILLLGRGGQVGWELQRSLAVLVELVVPDFVTAQIQSTNRSTSLVLFASSLHSRTRVKNDSWPSRGPINRTSAVHC